MTPASNVTPATVRPRKDREFEVVVFGATSFVGQILCRYLHRRFPASDDLRWAIAGRNPAKLDAINQELGTSLTTLVSDAQDSAALESMATRTRVVCTTVGPYAFYGSKLVAACVTSGTDYCDLTGEPQWMRRMIDEHEVQATETGARVVHACGFDSIPSDLGVWFTQREALQRFGAPCAQIRMGLKAARGGVSGGTVASLVNAVQEASADRELRRQLQNPYLLCPVGEQEGVRQPNVTRPTYDDELRAWLAPFVMAAINTRVVHRSHALAGRPWGDDFRYDESMLMGPGLRGRLRATATSVGLGGTLALLALGPTRALLRKTVLPKPGEGPSPAKQKAGFFDLRFFGRTGAGQRLRTKVTGDRDPGYGSTAKMLGEAAVCLARETPEAVPGGFLTPSIAMGEPLLGRLEKHAGLAFEVLELS
ncbi:MAG: saccharopine dehydrogenase family protein [Planctomycetota bacterium]